MRYTITGWFQGARVMLTWEAGRLRGPAAVLAAVVGHPAGRDLCRESTSLSCADGVVGIEDSNDAFEVVRRALDDIDGVVVRDTPRELGWRRRSFAPRRVN